MGLAPVDEAVRVLDVEIKVEDVQKDAFAEEDVSADLLESGTVLLRPPDISFRVVALVPACQSVSAAGAAGVGTATEKLWNDG